MAKLMIYFCCDTGVFRRVGVVIRKSTRCWKVLDRFPCRAIQTI